MRIASLYDDARGQGFSLVEVDELIELIIETDNQQGNSIARDKLKTVLEEHRKCVQAEVRRYETRLKNLIG